MTQPLPPAQTEEEKPQGCRELLITPHEKELVVGGGGWPNERAAGGGHIPVQTDTGVGENEGPERGRAVSDSWMQLTVDQGGPQPLSSCQAGAGLSTRAA